ncbi:MAG: serine hydrolase [Candidatus Obscuribacterales bacterium]|jgi:CubicO group peptidase (beta-lactamase class C family)
MPKPNQEALNLLVARASETHTDAMIIVQNGTTIGEWNFDKEKRPIETMSMTKSIVSLAIGRLLTEKKINSIDDPVWFFFPEWKQGSKEKITIRNILNHTSGLQDNPTTEEIYRSPDFLKFALAAELTSTPGECWFYSNKACNILPGIVERASGQKIDAYLRMTIFAALEIENFTWSQDSVGNRHGFAGLSLAAKDVAKIGQLMLQNGKWKGKQITDAGFVQESTKPAHQNCGLLWWIDYWGESHYASEHAETANVRGFSARGYLGQYLIAIPKQKLVAVRQIATASHKSETDTFYEFDELVAALFPN